jgi:hypothetical protein
MYHFFGFLNDGFVLPLYNPIFVRVVRNCVLPLDPCFNIEVVEILGGVFSSII